MQALTRCTIRCRSHSQNTLRMPTEIWSSPGADELAAFPSSSPTTSSLTRSKAPSSPFLWRVVAQWCLGEVGSQQGLLSLVTPFCNVAILINQSLSGLVDSGRHVPCRCPYIISFAFLEELVPALPLGPLDSSPEVASCFFEAADASWAVSEFSPTYNSGGYRGTSYMR